MRQERRRRPRLGLLAALAAAAAALASGCGLGAGKAPGGVQLLVTRDFGASTLRSFHAPQARGQETVMSLLTRNAKVGTRYSGGFVQSIDGLAGGREGGQPVDWFYYVNGIEAGQGAAATNLHPGDRVWWDRHDWGTTDDVPAVVGSYPEPFLNGIDGKRLPVRVECASASGAACRTVTKRLRAQGVPAAVSALGSGAGATHTLRVAVGPWRLLSGEIALRELHEGPQSSGVYARFSREGRGLALLDQRGRTVQTLGAGAGLIAATRSGEDAPVWAVTGTDDAGTEAAARDFDTATLHARFAVAVGPGGPLPLPLFGRTLDLGIKSG
ncbi:MAG TPA: DUF4430 domain-containing protein [Solirubrobacteraceae bacterium]|nr:DUF4430 domain-containing protein [Solirubrobacteraceae bacterium]